MKWRSILVAALVAIAALAQPLHVTAQAVDDATVERFDSEKFWTYAACAASIAIGIGAGGWVLTVVACGRAATEYWTE